MALYPNHAKHDQLDQPASGHAAQIALFLCLLLQYVTLTAQDTGLTFHGTGTLLVEGRNFVAADHFRRLPDSMQGRVREAVWDLSKCSAGLSLRFRTNSTRIALRWALGANFHMDHMADTGVKGLDLYYRDDQGWHYLTTARPRDKENEAVLIRNLPAEVREYKLHLPLYDELLNLQVGTDDGSVLEAAAPYSGLPLVFYGTSITQGGCASRPGMAHTNILSRALQRDCINLGFSGNGNMETAMAEYIAQIPASLIVVECLPNMEASQVRERTAALVRSIRREQPNTPILLVSNFMAAPSLLDVQMHQRLVQKNEALKQQFELLKSEGVQHIHLLSAEQGAGADGEGTVDGVHFTDLGFQRYAGLLLETITSLNLLK